MAKPLPKESIQAGLSRVEMFSALPKESLDTLVGRAIFREYSSRQVVYFPNERADEVYVLCEGLVKLFRESVGGRSLTPYILDGSGIFGMEGLLTSGSSYQLKAETIRPSGIIVLSRSDVLSVVREYTPALLALLKEVGGLWTQSLQQSEDLVFLTVIQRLAKLLLYMDAKGMLRYSFTHEQLAQMCGSTRETTTFTLNELVTKEAAIRFNKRKIIIVKRAILEKIVEG